MSEVTIELLQKENNELKSNAKGLVAQLDAAKGMLNDVLASNLQLRTNMNILTASLQESLVESSDLKRIKAENEKQIVELGQRITDLTSQADCG